VLRHTCIELLGGGHTDKTRQALADALSIPMAEGNYEAVFQHAMRDDEMLSREGFMKAAQDFLQRHDLPVARAFLSKPWIERQYAGVRTGEEKHALLRTLLNLQHGDYWYHAALKPAASLLEGLGAEGENMVRRLAQDTPHAHVVLNCVELLAEAAVEGVEDALADILRATEDDKLRDRMIPRVLGGCNHRRILGHRGFVAAAREWARKKSSPMMKHFLSRVQKEEEIGH